MSASALKKWSGWREFKETAVLIGSSFRWSPKSPKCKNSRAKPPRKRLKLLVIIRLPGGPLQRLLSLLLVLANHLLVAGRQPLVLQVDLPSVPKTEPIQEPEGWLPINLTFFFSPTVFTERASEVESGRAKVAVEA